MEIGMRGQIDAFHKDAIHQDQLPGNQLLSFAQQVSFPNWNAMVGDLGQKFARRSSLEKEVMNGERSSDYCSQKHGGGLCRNESDADGKDKNEERENVSCSVLLNENSSLERNDAAQLKTNYQEVEQSCQSDEGKGAKIHISSVSIVLRNGSEKKRLSKRETGDREIARDVVGADESFNNKNETSQTGEETVQKLEVVETINDIKSECPDGNETEEINKKNVLKRLKSLEQTLNRVEEVNNNRQGRPMVGQDLPNAEEDKFSSKKFGEDLMSINRMRQRLVKRSSGIEASQLTPEFTPKDEKENGDGKTHRKIRSRKKSSSFSGALPMYSEKESHEGLALSHFIERSNLAQRRRGTVDMGRVDAQKHASSTREKRHRHHDKKVDPSHYLMTSGKRRGSYNPTYNQYTPAVQNGKTSNSRAKSMFVCQVDERAALRERLMKHACPELRESLDREDDQEEETNRQKNQRNESAVHNGSDKTNDKKSQEEEDSQHRRIGRKAGIIPNSPLKTENDVFTYSDENEHKKLGSPRGLFNTGQFNRQRRQFVRTQSNLDGLPSMYLKKLHEKSVTIEHERITRSESDSISSASSSEGGEAMGPFPMHNAARNGELKLLHKFIADGMNVNAGDAEGWPPVHYALTSGHFDCVATLLQAGANISDYTKGRTSKYFR